jgi:pimeloyl-ACP methyl ester carboxylesterase
VLPPYLQAVMRIALFAAAGWVSAVWVCGAVYIAVTYVEAMRHVPERSLSALVRSVLRECWCVAWTQPLLIVFQLFGRRQGRGDPAGIPVVLVHGYFQNRVDFLYLARRLRRAGSGPIYACNFFWPQPFEASAITVRKFTQRVMEETGADRVDLLTHSSGGLLALDLLAEKPEWVRRVAVIAIPWRGVTWRGPVIGPSGSQLRADSLYTRSQPAEIDGGPVLSIYSAHDNLVHPPTTSRLVGPLVSVLEVSNLGHLAVLFDPKVGDAVCDFLLPAPDEVDGA